jgi:hypothetical protein
LRQNRRVILVVGDRQSTQRVRDHVAAREERAVGGGHPLETVHRARYPDIPGREKDFRDVQVTVGRRRPIKGGYGGWY